MDDLFPDRISILPINGWTPFRTGDLFPNRICILHTKYILSTDSLHLNGFFIPRTNYSPYDWTPVQMTARTNYSTKPIYLRHSSVNKLMTWSRTDYLSSVQTDDLFPDRIYILRTNRWPPFRTDDPFSNRISILCTNYYEFLWAIKTYVCSYLVETEIILSSGAVTTPYLWCKMP